MKQLEASLKKFIEIRNTYREYYTHCQFKEDEIILETNMFSNSIDQRIPLSPELKFFYDNCTLRKAILEDGSILNGVSIETGKSIAYISTPEMLYKRQIGFRWVGVKEPYREDDSWERAWVVIADRNEDPIMVDTSKPGSPVLARYEMNDFTMIAKSLAEFFEVLSIVIEVTYKKYHGEIMNDDGFEISEKFLDDLRIALGTILDVATQIENILDYLYEL